MTVRNPATVYLYAARVAKAIHRVEQEMRAEGQLFAEELSVIADVFWDDEKTGIRLVPDEFDTGYDIDHKGAQA